MSAEMRQEMSDGHFRAQWAILFLYASVVAAALAVGSGLLQWHLFRQISAGETVTKSMARANDDRHLLIVRVQLFLFILTAIVFLRWLYRSYANLRHMGSGRSDETPRWAVGYWFIPFINLVKPYNIVKELWHRTQYGNVRGHEAAVAVPATIGIWWASYLVTGFISRGAAKLSQVAETIPQFVTATLIDAGGDLLTVIAGLLLISIIRNIDRAQQAYAVPAAPEVAAAQKGLFAFEAHIVEVLAALFLATKLRIRRRLVISQPFTALRARWFWALAALILLTDCATKRVAEVELAPVNVPHPVVGDVVRFTLAYNQGSAMSLWTGPGARLLLSLFAVIAVAVILKLYRATPSNQRLRIAGLALVAGGAAGNLLDRLRSTRGVVDFIDVGFGASRFWVFNVADIGVTVGAVLLALAMTRDYEIPDSSA